MLHVDQDQPLVAAFHTSSSAAARKLADELNGGIGQLQALVDAGLPSNDEWFAKPLKMLEEFGQQNLKKITVKSIDQSVFVSLNTKGGARDAVELLAEFFNSQCRLIEKFQTEGPPALDEMAWEAVPGEAVPVEVEPPPENEADEKSKGGEKSEGDQKETKKGNK